MKEIIDKIDGSKEIDKDEVNIFTSFANIEQVIAGYNEMNEISKRIEGGETYNYLEEKKGLEKEVENRLSAKTGNVMKFFEEDE